jgi:hypothetical protein
MEGQSHLRMKFLNFNIGCSLINLRKINCHAGIAPPSWGRGWGGALIEPYTRFIQLKI